MEDTSTPKMRWLNEEQIDDALQQYGFECTGALLTARMTRLRQHMRWLGSDDREPYPPTVDYAWLATCWCEATERCAAALGES